MNKETEETVIDSFDRIYDKAIDHSIEIVRRVWSFAPLQEENNPFMVIITELHKLKSNGDTNNDNG